MATPYLFEPFFTPSECTAFISALEELPGWRIAGAECGETRVNNLPEKHSLTANLAYRTEQLIHNTWAFTRPSIRFSEAAIVRYSLGAVVPPHSDINHAKRMRIYSFIAYLTDDFKGGKLIIPSLNYCCAGKLGWIVFFPSTEIHFATTVTRGDKSVLVGFLEAQALHDS